MGTHPIFESDFDCLTDVDFVPMIRCTVGISIVRRLTIQQSYKLLGVDSKSTKDEIKTAYLNLCKAYHPDNLQTGDAEKFRQLPEAKEILFAKLDNPSRDSNHIPNVKFYHENADMDEEQYRAFLARRQIELTKRREERKAKVLAMAIAMVGVWILMYQLWYNRTTSISNRTKYEFIRIAKNHNVPVWEIFAEYKKYFIARHGRDNFSPTLMTWEEIWYLDQHFSNLHPLLVTRLLLRQTPELLRP